MNSKTRMMLISIIVVAAIGALVIIFLPTDQHQTDPPSSISETVSQPSLTTVPLREKDSENQHATPALTELFNADADDWDSERFANGCQRRLDHLAKLIESKQVTSSALESIAIDQVTSTTLLPEKRVTETVTLSEHVEARRKADGPTETYAGRNQLANELSEFAKSLGDAIHVKFKTVRVPADNETLARVEASGHGPELRRQITATWRCEWTVEDPAEPLLRSVQLQSYDEITAEEDVAFRDATRSVLEKNASYARQQLPGIGHWIQRLPRSLINQFGHHGLAVGDVNGDDLDDLYVCDAGGLPNRLYVQQADGTARDRSKEAGVDFLDESVSALLIDIDNDRDQDLILATDRSLSFLSNDGRGQFSPRLRQTINADTFSMTAADYDLDGDLDLYVCGYDAKRQTSESRSLPFPIPYNDANNGAANVLLRNDGEWSFTDVTQESGLNVNNRRFSMAAAWEDVDNDGDMDLYVANDFGRNNLYLNQGGRFVDVASAANVEDHASGMSVDWADFNRDGWMDVYVGNMFSSAGNRITYQSRFASGVSTDDVSQLRRMARGNTLFRNAGSETEPRFDDVSLSANVNMGRWAWASKFADLNNNGWPDIVVANGYLTNEDSGDL